MTPEQHDWDNAVHYAESARHWRRRKVELQSQLTRGPLGHEITPALCEAQARKWERRVRELALRAEIRLARQHHAASA